MSTVHTAIRRMPGEQYGELQATRTVWREYSDEEIRAAWDDEDGQGHGRAVQQDWACVVVECDEFDAVSLSRLFIRNVFAIPTCCHYDGRKLSLYCGDAGRGGTRGTLIKARALVRLWT